MIAYRAKHADDVIQRSANLIANGNKLIFLIY